MAQVVEGLLYLHSHNILHRDMSLANLLLTKDMRVVIYVHIFKYTLYFLFNFLKYVYLCFYIKKIADFGLATQLSRPDEKHMTMCGTPNYISPEVCSSCYC